MGKARLCLGTCDAYGRPVEEQIRLFRQAGFDGFFTEWHAGEDMRGYRRLADRLGMEYQSVHAPFDRAAALWETGPRAEAALDQWLCCLKDCAAAGVPVVVMHAFIGFQDHSPTKAGPANFQRIAAAARRLGVRIALENTEGEEYLAALMEAFRGDDQVGFCWDTGHELCYNRGRDLLRLYGDRLLCTHLNDNLGISDPAGEITWMDDLHLLPFDGVADWQGIARRLDKCGFLGPMTFELSIESKPGRHENDRYAAMPLEDFLALAYERARRAAALRADGRE